MKCAREKIWVPCGFLVLPFTGIEEKKRVGDSSRKRVLRRREWQNVPEGKKDQERSFGKRGHWWSSLVRRPWKPCGRQGLRK